LAQFRRELQPSKHGRAGEIAKVAVDQGVTNVKVLAAEDEDMLADDGAKFSKGSRFRLWIATAIQAQ